MDNDRPTVPGPGPSHHLHIGPGAYAWVQGAGDPLLLLHGWGLRPDIFKPALRQLATRDFHVAAPTLAVLGRTWHIDRAVGRALETLDLLKWDNAIVVGYSLGGAVATALTAMHPGRVRLLGLVNSIGLTIDRGPLGWALPFTRYANTRNAKALRAIGRNAFAFGGIANLAGAARYARGAALDRELATVRDHGTPAVVLWGANDRLLPADMGRDIAQVLRAPFHVVPNADHDWTVRQPELFARELDHILRLALLSEPRRFRSVNGRRQRRAARSDTP